MSLKTVALEYFISGFEVYLLIPKISKATQEARQILLITCSSPYFSYCFLKYNCSETVKFTINKIKKRNKIKSH